MAFVFDVAELAPGMGKSIGIYNYAVRLFQAMLPLLGPDCRMHLACNAGCADAFDTQGHPHVRKHVVIDSVAPSTLQRQRWMRWEAKRFAARVGASVYFTPKGFLPGSFGPCKGLGTVAVVHDLIPLWYEEHRPGHVGKLEQWVVNAGLLRTAKQADELVVISKATADDVSRHTGRGGHMHVVYNGVPWVQPRDASPLDEPYIMAVTSALPHKNAAMLLKAYAAYRERTALPMPLVVCGIEDPGQPGVQAMRGIDDETLHTLYAHAELLVFLSLIEGFGFPPVEAMSHGTPVLCSDIPSLREVTAGAATLVDPQDPQAIADAMQRVLGDEALRARQAQAGRQVVGQYDWATCAQGIKALLLAARPAR
jgi:glycosyltransferase involved in cell wall biosynthesis